MSVVEAGQKLRTRMWETRGSRFAARGRLRRTNMLSVTTVTLLSTYVIFISVVLLAFSGQLEPLNEKWLNIINIALSLLVIVFSLLEFSRDYLGQAEAMNQSALKIGEIYGELSAKVDGNALSQDELQNIEKKYSECLSNHPANHEPIDYELFKIMKHEDYKGWWSRHFTLGWIAILSIYLRSTWLYWLGILALPALAALLGKHLLTLAG